MIRLPNLPAALKRLPLPVGDSFVAFLLLSVTGLPCLLEAESEGDSRGLRLPEPLQENEFESLKARSPFLRTLDPSESLILDLMHVHFVMVLMLPLPIISEFLQKLSRL